MQSYTPISASDTLANGPAVINQNDQTILSCSSGTQHPTTNLQVGMLCYRTDLKQLHQLTDATTTPPTWTLLLDVGAGAGYASGLMSGGAAWQIATGAGPNWGAAIPRVGSDGGCEIGSYLDFHAVSNDTADNAVRLTGASGKLTCSGSIASTGLNVSPATGGANLTLSAPSGAQASTFYASGGATKWQSGMNGDASWFLYDTASGRFNIAATTGNLVLGGDGNLSLPPGGGATLNNGALTVNNNGAISTGGAVNGGSGSFGSLSAGALTINNGGITFPNNVYIYEDNNGAWVGDFSVRTYNGSYNYFTVQNNGNVSMASFTVTSDRRLKSDIEPLTGHGELIGATNVYAYTKKGRREWGVIAQELQEIAPELVHEGRDGMLEVDYMSLVAAMLAELRSHRQRLAALEAG